MLKINQVSYKLPDLNQNIFYIKMFFVFVYLLLMKIRLPKNNRYPIYIHTYIYIYIYANIYVHKYVYTYIFTYM